MFGNYFKHVLVLTLLAGLTYSLPQVKDAMAGAFTIGYSDASAYTAAVGDLQKSVAEQISVRSIVAKVAYDSKRQETAINISAKVQITAKTSDIKVADDSFSFTLRNRTLSLDGRYTRSSSAVSNLTKGPDGYYTIKAGTTALFSVTASANPASMVAGQYYATLVVVSTYDSKLTVPSNQSNNFVVVGEASPFITLVGQGLYGSKDTIILNAVRLGKNPTITFKPAYDICEVGQVCPPSAPKTFSLRGSHNSKQIKFNLNGKDLKPAQYQVYVTNNELGELAGKSNTVWIQVLDQSKILTAKVIAGKLALAYDAQNQEASLSALFEATIKAGDTDLTFDQSSFFVRLDSNVYSSTADTKLVSVGGKSASFPYTLKAKREARIVISAFVNPKILVGGVYTMSVGGISPSTNNGTQRVYIQVNENKTTELSVVGEVSPYITSVSPNPATVGQTFSINGARLNDINDFDKVYIDGNLVTGVDGSKDGTVLFFKLPSLTDGYHMLQVKDSVRGASNIVWFESAGYISPYSVTVINPNGGEQYNVGQQVTINLSITNPDQSPVAVSLTKIGQENDIIGINGDLVGNTLTWTIPNTVTSASDYVIRAVIYKCSPPSDPNSTITCAIVANDISNSGFTIVAPVTPPSLPFVQVLTPNGGEALVKGSNYRITWSSNIATTSTVNIGIKRCPSCFDDINFSAPNTGSYDWVVGMTPLYPPVDQPGYQIKIVAGDYRGSASDTSDGYFMISTSTVPTRLPPEIIPTTRSTTTRTITR